MNKILLLDNYDSFTYNLYHLVQKEYSGKVEVLRDSQIDLKSLSSYSAIVISPGPGRPQTTPAAMNILNTIPETMPVLGICLGMQCINEFFGGETVRGDYPLHGKVYKLHHDCRGLFHNIPDNIDIARYHSLVINIGNNLNITSRSDDGVIMSIEHKTRPVYGIQFHPESFLTQYGDRMVANFLKEVR